jgi:hypothetical protein
VVNNPNGKIGINTNAPTATLHIKGDYTVQPPLRIEGVEETFAWDFDPGYVMLLNTDGYVFKETREDMTSYSDRRLKHDIQPLAPGLSFVKKLQPVEYVFNFAKNGTKTMGFIAQDLQEVMSSEKMDTAAYGMVFVKDKKNGYFGVKYDEMIPILTNAIKEQQTIIEKQQAENAELKALMDSLVKRIEVLEKK